MARIQAVALDLFDERGYERSIEQIADAADVSPSSVYRYFGTKEQLVLYDELDVQLLDVIEARARRAPPGRGRAPGDLPAHGPLLRSRRGARPAQDPLLDGRTGAPDRRRASDRPFYAWWLPACRATGRPADDLDVQVVATTLVWAMNAAARHWYANGYARPLEDELQRALTLVENGLRLD